MSEPTVAYSLRPMVDPNDVMLDFILEQFDETFAPDHVGTEPPSTGLAARLPFALSFYWDGTIDRQGGAFIIDLSIFESTYTRARDTARAVEDRLLGYPFRVSSGGRSVLVDMVEAVTPTREVDWEQDSTIRRFQGTYRLSVRR